MVARQIARSPTLFHSFDTPRTPPLILYSDAEGRGGIGSVALPLHSCVWAAGTVPPDVVSLLHPRETQINPLELLAVLAAIEQFSASARGSRVLFFLDNTAALGILLRGSSPQSDLNALAEAILARCLELHLTPFWRWAPSALNMADPPSRGRAPPFGRRVPCLVRWDHIRRRRAGLHGPR